jgi:hypothetical protein
MFRPAWNNPYGFDASGSGDLTLPPPTMLTEAFVTAHTEVLRQLLQAQQRMAQQLPHMPPLQQKVQPSNPYSPEVPTQSDINAIVGATQLLEGQNSMLNQMVYDIVTYQKFHCFPKCEFSQKFKTFCLNLCATKFEPNLLASHPKFSLK